MAPPSPQCSPFGPGTLLWRPALGDSSGLTLKTYHAAAELPLQQRGWDARPDKRYKRYATVAEAEGPLQADVAAAQSVLLRVRIFLQKTVRLVARTAVITSVASAVGLFAACEFDDAKTLAAIVSIPRTVAAISWGIKAAGAYRRVLDEYQVRRPRHCYRRSMRVVFLELSCVRLVVQPLACQSHCRFMQPPLDAHCASEHFEYRF